MSWDKIENHLFDKYCVEGEDKELCNLMAEHDAEIRAKAIDELVEEAMKEFTDFDLKHGYPTVADCKGILRDVAEQLKGGAV